MRDRVFLQGRVTEVAILFRSVLTAHALFHTNEDPMRVLMLNPRPGPVCKAGDLICSNQTRSGRERVQRGRARYEQPRSEIVNKVTHTLTCTHARRFPFP